MIRHYLKKEIRLQRPNRQFAWMALAVEILLWFLAADSAREITDSRFRVGEIVLMIHYGILTPVFLLLIPLFVGIAAGVGDRDAGIMDWCMSLPAPRWKQWLLKALAATATACLFVALYLAANALIPARVNDFDASLASKADRHFNEAWRGLSPLCWVPWLVTLGMYAGSISRTYYRAFVVVICVVAVAGLAPFIMDPLGQTFLLPMSHPIVFEMPWLHFLHAVMLAVAAAWFGLRYFRFEPPRLRRIALAALVWIVGVNVTAFALVRFEYTLRDFAIWLEPSPVPGVVPLVRHGRIDSLTHFTRIPGADAIVMSAELMPAQPEFRRTRNDPNWSLHSRLTVLEVGVGDGEIRQYPHVGGNIISMNPKGRCFEVQSYSAMIQEGMVLRGTPFYVRSRGGISGRALVWAGLSNPESWGVSHEWAPSLGSFPVGRNQVCYLFQRRALTPALVRGDGALSGTNHFAQLLLDVRQPGVERVIDMLEQSDRDPRFHCVSPDARWFARIGRGESSVLIRSTDDSSTRTLGLQSGMTAFVCGPPWAAMGEAAIPSDLALPNPGQVFAVSPSGRFMAYYGVLINYDPLGEQQYEYGVLDLESGEKHALIEGTWKYSEPSPVRPNWIVDLPMTWSDDGILSCLTPDGLSFFRETSGADAPVQAGALDLKPIWPLFQGRDGFVGGTLRAPAFWDNDTLLLFGQSSLWRVDLRATNPELFARN